MTSTSQGPAREERWHWAKDGSGQWLETFDETVPMEAIPDYLNALERERDAYRQALEGLVKCIETSARFSKEGLGSGVAIACEVIANTTQMQHAREALALSSAGREATESKG